LSPLNLKARTLTGPLKKGELNNKEKDNVQEE
jgi:hypothetical protein